VCSDLGVGSGSVWGFQCAGALSGLGSVALIVVIGEPYGVCGWRCVLPGWKLLIWDSTRDVYRDNLCINVSRWGGCAPIGAASDDCPYI
jgi:hypothetical protein